MFRLNNPEVGVVCLVYSIGRIMRPVNSKNQAKKKTLLWALLVIFFTLTICKLIALKTGHSMTRSTYAAKAISGDLDRDGDVDLDDLQLFSQKWLGLNWQDVDWCLWFDEHPKYKSRFAGLYDFVVEYFQCGQPPEPPLPPEDPLAVKNSNNYPTRLAWGLDARLYVSDAKVGSVFIYELISDANSNTVLDLTGELKGLGAILGVVVDSNGLICVSNSKHHRVEKYNLQGELVATVGEDTLLMPTDIALDWDDNLYVADSQSSIVWVYKPDGTLLRTVRKGGLKTPMSVEVAYYSDGTGNSVGELYVADKSDYLVKVFDLQGNLLRSYGGFVTKEGWFNPTWKWQGKFVSLQSLAVDYNGDLHALDCFMNRVQILDPVTGGYLGSYGESGTSAGQLTLPLDIVITDAGEVIVANAGNRRVEIIYTVP